MKIVKRVCAFTLSVAILLMAAACGGTENPSPTPAQPGPGAQDTPTPSSPEPGDIPRIVLTRWSGPHADDQKVVTADYPYANVVIDDIDYSNLQQREIQSMTSTADYDLVWIPEVWLAEYVKNGWLLPLDSFIEDSGFDLGAYASGMIDINTLDGQIWALPSFAQTMIMVVNKEWFDREGQSIPKTPEEMVEVARYFKEKGTGIAIPAVQGMPAVDIFATILYSAGGDYFDANGKLNLLSEEAIYAATIWDQLCDYAMDGAAMWFNDEASEAVRTEKSPFGIVLSGLASQDMDTDRSLIADKAVYLPVPPKKSASGVAATWSWGIPANSKNPQAAFDFLTWLIGPEADKAQALKNAQITALSSIAEDPEVTSRFPFMKAAADTLANGKTQPINPGAIPLMDPLAAALSELAVSNRTPLEVFTELQNSMVDIVSAD